MILTIICAVIFLPLIVAGIVGDLLEGDLGPRLHGEHSRRRPLPDDGAFMDGMITGAALIELEEMFR